MCAATSRTAVTLRRCLSQRKSPSATRMHVCRRPPLPNASPLPTNCTDATEPPPFVLTVHTATRTLTRRSGMPSPTTRSAIPGADTDLDENVVGVTGVPAEADRHCRLTRMLYCPARSPWRRRRGRAGLRRPPTTALRCRRRPAADSRAACRRRRPRPVRGSPSSCATPAPGRSTSASAAATTDRSATPRRAPTGRSRCPATATRRCRRRRCARLCLDGQHSSLDGRTGPARGHRRSVAAPRTRASFQWRPTSYASWSRRAPGSWTCSPPSVPTATRQPAVLVGASAVRNLG